MSLLDTIKSAVLADEPEKSVPEAAGNAPTVTSPMPTSAPYMMAPAVVSPAPVNGAPVSDFLVKLRSKLQDPGSIIDKFENSLSSLSMIPDLGMRATAAISVLTASAGITAQQLRAAYASRINALDEEASQFLKAVSAQSESEVGARQDRLKQISAELDVKAKEIEALAAQRESLNREIAAAKSKLDVAKSAFDGAASMIRNELQDASARLPGN